MKVQSLSKNQVTSCYDSLARARKFPDNTLLHQSILKLIDLELKGADQIDILDAGSGAVPGEIVIALLLSRLM